jgi:hypothetical protein
MNEINVSIVNNRPIINVSTSTTAVQRAINAASEAEQSASEANQSAIDSSQSAGDSTQSAIEASQSATAANQSAIDAGLAKDAAELAQSETESARDQIINNIDFTGQVEDDIYLVDDTGIAKPKNKLEFLQDVVTTLSGRIALDLEDYFVIEVNTAITGTGTVSATNQFQFTGAVGNYSVQAYQGDTLVQTYLGLSGQQTITLPSSGTYNLRVIPAATSGFNRILFNNGGDRAKLLKIKAWGNKVVWSSFENAFNGCVNNTTLPVYLIKNTQSVTSFASCFNNNQLTLIPSGLFNNCPNVTNFLNCFNNNQLASIPSGLFDNCPNVTNFQTCFQSNQLTSIPLGLFDNCTLVTNFSFCFNANQLTSIPLGLFDNCQLVTNFSGCFRINQLTSISVGLFDNCPNVTTFANCFNDNQLTLIPSGLFDNCSSVTGFLSCFANNPLTSIPSGLFDNCPNVTNFSGCFLSNQLTLIPSGLFDNCPNVTNFSGCFRNNGIINTCPPDLFKFNTICTNWSDCFNASTLATADYSGMLVSLNTFNANNATFHGGSSRYTGQDAIDARANLINVKNWTITDGGLL